MTYEELRERKEELSNYIFQLDLLDDAAKKCVYLKCYHDSVFAVSSDLVKQMTGAVRMDLESEWSSITYQLKKLQQQ